MMLSFLSFFLSISFYSSFLSSRVVNRADLNSAELQACFASLKHLTAFRLYDCLKKKKLKVSGWPH